THVLPFFGRNRSMSAFAVEDIERFIGHMKAQPGSKGHRLSAVRVNKARNLLRQLLERAVKNRWLPDNPVAEVGRLREDPAEIDPMSWTEVGRLLEKGFPHDPELRRFYTVAIFTGLRTSELIGLKWGDLDCTVQPPAAHIKRSFTKHDGEHLTKTRGSTRTVHLRPQDVETVKKQ